MILVGKKLSELIRDSGSQTPGSEQGRWQAELAQVAIELIAVVTNSGRASTLAATDAAAPTLRRIERAAIAAATPITYHSRELLLLIHEHLQASGLTTTADSLLKEAQLTPLPFLTAPTSLLNQTSIQETPSAQLQWPSGRAPRGFLSNILKVTSQGEDPCRKCDSVRSSSKKKPLAISCYLNSQSRNHPSHPSSVNKISGASKKSSTSTGVPETPSLSMFGSNSDIEPQLKTPIVLPMKRKLESKDTGVVSPGKRLATSDHGFWSPVCPTPNTVRKSNLSVDVTPSSSQRDQFGRLTPGAIFSDTLDESQYNSTISGHPADPQPVNPERVTLDSLVVQYLKHQHRQCPAPITTLPPLSLLHPHACPESKCSLDAPANVTARLSKREVRNCYSGMHANRRDRQFVYSRFRPWRTCRDDSALITCLTFLGDFSQIATGSHSGELKIYDSNSGNMLETYMSHQSPVTLVQSVLSGGTCLVLSSGSHDVCLWDASSVSGGPMHSFEGCKSARFSSSGTTFAALSTESSRHEVLLYDIQTHSLELKLCDTSTGSSTPGRGHMQYPIHFSPSDTMLLWNGVLWDRRSSAVVRRFDQFTDYGGGGFHPGGNEVIINSEVWDLRKFKLLRSVPSLDQTVITFNACGDVIYAILRRNLEDIMSAVHTRRVRHPLFAAFRTVDAANYSDIATVPVDRCVLDLATESTDSFVGLVCMDDHEEMFASARLYEIDGEDDDSQVAESSSSGEE
ncbi:WD40 repeat [Macleaya cordata]|uniref:WD40 repeat n=1 Tax=Macleaya cordata TaxID=56857 RepID=A0A200Q193_MACCD|nr:WD40 repeat [Macleaya cordata]